MSFLYFHKLAGYGRVCWGDSTIINHSTTFNKSYTHQGFLNLSGGLMQVSDGFLEPLLEELGQELKDALSDVGGMLFEQLSSRLPLLASPDELFQFFTTLEGKYALYQPCN